jgi:superfamily II DNA or RNA helicase
MNIRDIRQEEFAYEYLRVNKNGILYLCPRFGKTKTALKILTKLSERLNKKLNVLIAFPEKNIMKSWNEEVINYTDFYSCIKYSTFASLKKEIFNKYDLVIIDEIHLLSSNQIDTVKIIGRTNKILGLTGTMSLDTTLNLKAIGLPVIKYYSIKSAVEEGIIKDYNITVHYVGLDNKLKRFSNGRTEKRFFEALSYLIEKDPGAMHLRSKRFRLIQNSISKLNKTKLLLISGEKCLVVCGNTTIADIVCNSYHLKNKTKDNLNKFLNNEIDHLSIVKLARAGITYPKLNKVIINFFDSNSENLTQAINRAMNLDYDNPKQIADIHIVSSNTEVEKKWLKSALEFFEPNKINEVYE